MVNPIPENIKDVLKSLSAPQQVTLRSYIATLRSEIKELEGALAAKSDPDPRAHYHGDQLCTADHSHGHEHSEKEEEHQHHGDHSHNNPHDDKKKAPHEGHEHHHDHGHKCEEDHDHRGHDHGHHKEHDDHHHEHEHHEKEHGHEHHHKEEPKKDVPAWKKAAMQEGDASAAPFGGSWTAESNISASDHGMKDNSSEG